MVKRKMTDEIENILLNHILERNTLQPDCSRTKRMIAVTWNNGI